MWVGGGGGGEIKLLDPLNFIYVYILKGFSHLYNFILLHADLSTIIWCYSKKKRIFFRLSFDIYFYRNVSLFLRMREIIVLWISSSHSLIIGSPNFFLGNLPKINTYLSLMNWIFYKYVWKNLVWVPTEITTTNFQLK